MHLYVIFAVCIISDTTSVAVLASQAEVIVRTVRSRTNMATSY